MWETYKRPPLCYIHPLAIPANQSDWGHCRFTENGIPQHTNCAFYWQWELLSILISVEGENCSNSPQAATKQHLVSNIWAQYMVNSMLLLHSASDTPLSATQKVAIAFTELHFNGRSCLLTCDQILFILLSVYAGRAFKTASHWLHPTKITG